MPAARGSGLELRDPPDLNKGPRGMSASDPGPEGSSWETCRLLTLEALGLTRHWPGPAPAASPATTCKDLIGHEQRPVLMRQLFWSTACSFHGHGVVGC